MVINITFSLRYMLFFCISLILSCKVSGQEEVFTVVEAEHIRTISTGKRHNSHFFVFKLRNPGEGIGKDSLIISQEIYNDFGASQTISKFSQGNVILKYTLNELSEGVYYQKYNLNYFPVNIIWVSEMQRKNSLIRLEKILTDIDADYLNLLEEEGGKFFFTEGNKRKVAVETRSGYWLIATIEKLKYEED